MKIKIVHIMKSEKVIPPFIDFIDSHLDISEHKFIYLNKVKYQYGLTKDHPIIWINKKKDIPKFLYELNSATKIIIHGLFSKRLMSILYIQPWLYKKCYWVMWGGDFYFPNKQTWLTKKTIKNVGHLVSAIRGEYELAVKWYGATGVYHEGFVSIYPNNLYKEYHVKEKTHNSVNILLGNSSYPTNNHLEIFEELLKFKEEDIKIFVPLSYGDKKYSKIVIREGEEKFGDKFIPLTNFMPLEQYLIFLEEIDIAIFNNNRQQALGNIIALLGFGKKVYMRNDVTPWKMFQEKNIKIFDVSTLDLTLIDNETKVQNKKRVKEVFSEENLIKRLKELF